MIPKDRHVIIIADSLTNDFANPRKEFLNIKVNLGAAEIARVMGKGDAYGSGPLPLFLRKAWQAAHDGERISTIFVRDLHDPDDPAQQSELLFYGEHNIRDSKGADFVHPLVPLLNGSHIISTTSLSIPAAALHRVFRLILGTDILELSERDRDRITLIVTGFYTDLRVMSTAFKLRHDYGFPNVFVCPHLVGSKDFQAHRQALQFHLPHMLVQVVAGLQDMGELAGLKRQELALNGTAPCLIEPAEIRDALGIEEKAIIENLFLFSSTVHLRPLSGGFSGSFIFFARGESQGKKTAPLIVKMADHRDIHRELQGYASIKDLLGSHAPAINLPVSLQHKTGISMSVASMEGDPATLQSIFRKAGTDGEIEKFLTLYARALNLLKDRLYENTRTVVKYSPYLEFGLKGSQQQEWLRENIGHILPPQHGESHTLTIAPELELPGPAAAFAEITGFADYLQGDACICHGDLNFANLLTDGTGALWLVDWAYTGEKPLEFDFAKLENDIKFVMSSEFTGEDLPDFALFEEFLLSHIRLPDPGGHAETARPSEPGSPPDHNSPSDPCGLPESGSPHEHGCLPPELSFVKDDRRYRKIYGAVKLTRDTYLSIRNRSVDALYRIALLKYAVHTLSFDRRRNRGECSADQLACALISTCLLTRILQQSDLHQTGTRERPDDYPPRAAVPARQIPWHEPFPGYAPPDHTSAGILGMPPAAGAEKGIDPPDWTEAGDLTTRETFTGTVMCDSSGRPLNPMGRTGISGRGFFYRWGPNHSVDPVITRINPSTQDVEFLLVKRMDTKQWALPGTMVLKGESPLDALVRAAKEKAGILLDPSEAKLIRAGYMDDYRNTDNAWVESRAFHCHQHDRKEDLAPSSSGVIDGAWIKLTPEFTRLLFAKHAAIIKECLLGLLSDDDLSFDRDEAGELLKYL